MLFRSIKRLYQITLSREPTRVELSANEAFLQKQRLYALSHGNPSQDAAIMAALMDLAQVMLDSNEFIYIG